MSELDRLLGIVPESSVSPSGLGYNDLPTTSKGAGWHSGVAGFEEGLGHIGQALFNMDNEDFIKRKKAEAEFYARNAPGATSFTGPGGVMDGGKVSDWLAFNLAQSAPSMIPMIAGSVLTGGSVGLGLAGRELATGAARMFGKDAIASGAERALAGQAEGAITGAMERQALDAAARQVGTRYAATTGAALGEVPVALGDILTNQYDTGKGYNVPMALAGTVPYIAADVLTGGEAALLRGATGGLERSVKTGVLPTIMDYGKRVGTTALTGGAGEVGQDVINQTFGKMAVDPSIGLSSMTTPEFLKQELETLITAGAMEGIMGAPAHLFAKPALANTEAVANRIDGLKSSLEDIIKGNQTVSEIQDAQKAETERVAKEQDTARQQAATAFEKAKPEPLPLLPYDAAVSPAVAPVVNPLGTTPIVFPDGTVAVTPDQALTTRYAPQPIGFTLDGGDGSPAVSAVPAEDPIQGPLDRATLSLFGSKGGPSRAAFVPVENRAVQRLTEQELFISGLEPMLKIVEAGLPPKQLAQVQEQVANLQAAGNNFPAERKKLMALLATLKDTKNVSPTNDVLPTNPTPPGVGLSDAGRSVEPGGGDRLQPTTQERIAAPTVLAATPADTNAGNGNALTNQENSSEKTTQTSNADEGQNANETQKALLKGGPNAIQKQAAASVDVQPEASNGETLGQGNAQNQVTPATSETQTKGKVNAYQPTNTTQEQNNGTQAEKTVSQEPGQSQTTSAATDVTDEGDPVYWQEKLGYRKTTTENVSDTNKSQTAPVEAETVLVMGSIKTVLSATPKTPRSTVQLALNHLAQVEADKPTTFGTTKDLQAIPSVVREFLDSQEEIALSANDQITLSRITRARKNAISTMENVSGLAKEQDASRRSDEATLPRLADAVDGEEPVKPINFDDYGPERAAELRDLEATVKQRGEIDKAENTKASSEALFKARDDFNNAVIAAKREANKFATVKHTLPETPMSKEAVQTTIDNYRKGWKTLPDTTVVSLADMTPEDRANMKNRLGRYYTDADGRPHIDIVAESHSTPSDVVATIYHEGLGHFGVQKKFEAKKIAVMNAIYNTNDTVRRLATTELANNPKDHTGSERFASATEEVLAQMSEKGTLPQSALNRLIAFVRGIARDMGMQVKFSDNDVKAILRQAHEAARSENPVSSSQASGFKSQVVETDKEGLKGAFGLYDPATNISYVRSDLSPTVKRFVTAHEQHHGKQTEEFKTKHPALAEVAANLFPGFKDPIGLMATVAKSMTPERLKFYADRVRGNTPTDFTVPDTKPIPATETTPAPVATSEVKYATVAKAMPTVQQIHDIIAGVPKTKVLDKAYTFGLRNLTTLDQLVDLAKNVKMPAFGDFQAAQAKIDTHMKQWVNYLTPTSVAWENMKKEPMQRFNVLLTDSEAALLRPDKPLRAPENSFSAKGGAWENQEQMRAAYNELVTRYNALPAESKTTFTAAFDAGKKAIQEHLDGIEASVNRNIADPRDRAEILSQVRAHWAAAVSGRPYLAHHWFGDWKMEVDYKDGSREVLSFETENQARNRLKELETQGAKGRYFRNEQFYGQQSAVSRTALNDISAAIDKNTSGEVADTLKKAIQEAYYSSLPETAGAQHLRYRKNTSGWQEGDLSRAWAQSMHAMARMTAKLQNMDSIRDAVEDAERQSARNHRAYILSTWDGDLAKVVKKGKTETVIPATQKNFKAQIYTTAAALAEERAKHGSLNFAVDMFEPAAGAEGLDSALKFAPDDATRAKWMATLKPEADKVKAEFNKLRSDSEANGTKQAYTDALRYRYEQMLKADSTHPVSSAATTLGFMYYLGWTPAFAIMNLTQVPMISAPRLAARFGGAKAMAALKNAYGISFQNRDVMVKLMKSATFWQGESDVVSIEKLKGVTDGQRQMLANLLERGGMDFTQDSELNSLIRGTPKPIQKMMKSATWLAHPTEVMNRMVTALATYDLAIKDGQSQKQAMDTAYELTQRTQMNYSPSNRIQLMNNPFLKPMLQFKQFGQQMTWELGKAIRESFSKDPAIRREQRAFLLYTMMSSGLIAGVNGMPFMGTILMLASIIGGDDDDPYDAKFELGQALGPIAANGVMGAFLADWSRRVGLGDVIPLPGLNGNNPSAPTAKSSDNLKNWAFDAIGPSGGVLKGVLDGWDQMDQGNALRGLEMAIPKAGRDVLKSARYATGGATTGDGVIRIHNEEFSVFDLMAVSMGFKPATEGEIMDKANYLYNRKAYAALRAGLLVKEMIMAKEGGDSGDVTAVQAKIDSFNAANPVTEIPSKRIDTAIKAKANRQQISDLLGGIGFSKQDTELVRQLELD